MLFDDNGVPRTVKLAELEYFLLRGEIDITEQEIADKSKGDMLSKGLVIIQTGWFVLQCIARGVEHLPITQIEIMTLAYAVLNFVTYSIWWKKPLNVQCPCPVLRKASSKRQDGHKIAGAGEQEEEQEEGGEKESFWMQWIIFHKENKDEMLRVILPMVFIAMIFGAIHCIAWSFEFPSHTDQIMWRISSLEITCVPLLVAVYMLGMSLPIRTLTSFPLWLKVLCTILYLLGSWMYNSGRMTLIVLAFKSLKSLPPGAYEKVRWTGYIPHI